MKLVFALANISRLRLPLLAAVSACAAAALPAQREAVLKQINVPHPYYFREMYLPQLTTGPSGAAWMPDGAALVYAMRGSLWKQALDATSAAQLTAGGGYDYQPDVSPDGKWVVFDRYDGNAVELEQLELDSVAVVSVEDHPFSVGRDIGLIVVAAAGGELRCAGGVKCLLPERTAHRVHERRAIRHPRRAAGPRGELRQVHLAKIVRMRHVDLLEHRLALRGECGRCAGAHSGKKRQTQPTNICQRED